MARPFENTTNAYRRRLQLGMMSAWRRMRRDAFDPRQFKIANLTVKIPGLARGFSGYRIVQITDLHVGHWITAPRLYGVADLVNRQSPDLVVLTGDYVSYVVDEIAGDLREGLSRLQAPDGVLAILGNHDHWMGAGRIAQIVSEAGARVLRNEVFAIQRPDGCLYVAGLDDVMLKQDDLPGIIERLDGAGPVILLAHEPDFAVEAAASGRFALQLSGHSHGGQVVIPGLGPIIRGPGFWKYPLGLYQVGEMVLYTSPGIGTHVLRLRVNCPPEISVITLYPAD
jgi:uncharacterized protein